MSPCRRRDAERAALQIIQGANGVKKATAYLVLFVFFCNASSAIAQSAEEQRQIQERVEKQRTQDEERRYEQKRLREEAERKLQEEKKRKRSEDLQRPSPSDGRVPCRRAYDSVCKDGYEVQSPTQIGDGLDTALDIPEPLLGGRFSQAQTALVARKLYGVDFNELGILKGFLYWWIDLKRVRGLCENRDFAPSEASSGTCKTRMFRGLAELNHQNKVQDQLKEMGYLGTAEDEMLALTMISDIQSKQGAPSWNDLRNLYSAAGIDLMRKYRIFAEQAERQLALREAALRKKEIENERARMLDEERVEVIAGAQADWADLISARIRKFWTRPPASAERFNCFVQVQIEPGGAVVSTRIVRSCGTTALDRSVETAVLKASPLPQPQDPKAFTPDLRITFCPADNACQ